MCVFKNSKKDIECFYSKIKDMDDLHILRFYSAFVAVSNGVVIKVSKPIINYCPLADVLYSNLGKDKAIKDFDIRKEIKNSVDCKIKEFGFFTDKRRLYSDSISIKFGASELSMYALRKKEADAVVMVCDGVGTVIVPVPEIVQGIGMRMNGLFYTSPITKTIQRLKNAGCGIPFVDAKIDQYIGIAYAAKVGYKKIIVTINGFSGEKLKEIREMEKKCNISVTIMGVCNTGISNERLREINKYADIIWSCGSNEVRKLTGRKALIQLSKAIPVFVMTQRGVNIISAYFENKNTFKNISCNKQCLVCDDCNGKEIKAEGFVTRIIYTALPVLGKRNPVMR